MQDGTQIVRACTFDGLRLEEVMDCAFDIWVEVIVLDTVNDDRQVL